MAARQAARRRIEQHVENFPQRVKRKFSVQPFSKGWRGGGQSPPRPPQRAKSLMIPKDQEGRQNVPVGRFAVGNPIKGFPAGRSPALFSHQTITAPARRNGKRFDSLARFFALENGELRHAAISLKLRPRGHPRAACGPPFPIFGLRPRRNGVKVSRSAEREEGSALHLPAF